MPVYNAERFLAEAMDSVLQQTFTDFEFLILDDASTDNSVNIIRSYDDPRIRFYKNDKNMGISATLNRGISLANSDLIARMDADDICYPVRLQRQYDYITAHPECAMVSCWVRVITEDGSLVRQENFRSEFYYYNLTFECWIYHPTILFRKAAVLEICGYTVTYSEDFELFWQISRKYKIYNLPELLLDYRVTSQSLHQVQKKDEYEDAQHQQVVRNLRYYTTDSLSLPAAQVECLRHNFTPLLKKGTVRSIVESLTVLEKITSGILEKPNPNREPKAIIEAAFHKRRFILNYYFRHLPRHKALYLMVKTKAWWFLAYQIKYRLKIIFYR